MSDLLIRGMEMPKLGYREIRIHPNGRITEVDECGIDEIVGTAVSIPPHGRLVDADALIRDNGIKEIPEYYEVVCDAPTIIPAEEDEL